MPSILGSWGRGRRPDDEDAVRAAYQAHAGELYGFAARALGDRGLAEDAVQETFLRAWRAAARYDPGRGSLRTWLFAICRHVVIDLSRGRAARPPLAPAERPDREAAVDELDRALVAVGISEALRQLGDRHRVVLEEVALRGRPVAEVARDLGVPVGTVHSRLYYAMKALGVALEEMGWLDDR